MLEIFAIARQNVVALSRYRRRPSFLQTSVPLGPSRAIAFVRRSVCKTRLRVLEQRTVGLSKDLASRSSTCQIVWRERGAQKGRAVPLAGASDSAMDGTLGNNTRGLGSNAQRKHFRCFRSLLSFSSGRNRDQPRSSPAATGTKCSSGLATAGPRHRDAKRLGRRERVRYEQSIHP